MYEDQGVHMLNEMITRQMDLFFHQITNVFNAPLALF